MNKLEHVPSDWNVVSLSSVADVIDPHPSHRAPNEDSSGIPFAGIGDLDEYGTLLESKVRRVPEEVFDEHTNRYQLTSNTIGFGRVASIGKIVDFKGFNRKVTISPTMAIVEPKGVEKKFLVNSLKSQDTADQISLLLTGSTRSSLGIALLRDLLVPYPPLPEQQKIATILSSVDDVIEKTQAQIDKLKDLKTGMMQELLTMGVCDENGKRHTEFKDSPVGRIPAGWDVVNMDDICNKITDGEHQTPKRTSDGYYLLSARNIRDGYIALNDVDFVPEDEYQRISKRVLPEKGDILISCSGSIGRTAVVPDNLKFSMVRSVAILQPKREVVDSQFLAYQISSTIIQSQIEKSLSQLAQANLFQAPIKALNVVVPPMDEQLKISSAVRSVDDMIHAKASTLDSIKNTKKALMQDLLTGKVRVNVD